MRYYVPCPHQAAGRLCGGCAAALPLLTLYATQAVWLQNLLTPFSWMASHLPASGLFWLLFFSLMLPLYGLTRRLFIAYLPGTGFCMTLAIISRYKMDINGAPLQLSDFTFVGNLGDIAGFASDMLAPTLTVVVSVIVCILWTVLLAVLEKWHPSGTVGFLAIALSLALLLSAAYPGTLQEAAMALDQTCQDQEDRSQELGVMLGLYAALAHRIEDGARHRGPGHHGPGGPVPGRGQPARHPRRRECPGHHLPDLRELFRHHPPARPDVLGGPLPNFHRLAETCTDGLFISDTYGGGTGHVEMEMFTGLTSSLLREGDTLNTLSLSVYQDLPTTARLLKNAGYSTVALHSHTDELYNRANVLPRIGFDTVAFREDFMTEGTEDGAYLSDASLVQEMIARYESRDPSKPIFLYGLSMENHQLYTAEKYSYPSGIDVQCDKLSQEDKAILDSLVLGLHHADASLAALVEYFSQVDRPVMLVFVGDHLPSPESGRRDAHLHPPGVFSHAGGLGLGRRHPGKHAFHQLPHLDQL
ncbi:MAG: LTA synthase family protein [Evtepia sp.]